MKRLVAGPWNGEFGWELFAWHAYIRSLSRKFDHTTIISRNNSRALYEDFADEFVAYEPSGGLSDSFFMQNVDIRTCFKEAVEENNITLVAGTSIALPRRIGIPPHTHYTQHVIFGDHTIKPEYICFGSENKRKYDYIFHIRERELRKEDNWSIENWQKLSKLLGNKKIACIGTKEESGHIEGTEDLRDIKLSELFTILRNSECAFGSSSGPMHLASLCGLPHVVWSIPQNKVRYEENWNPLKTKVLFNSDFSWHPTPEYIYDKFLGWKDV
jgi:ADP-heptose:LPS heptosyltransferase